MDLTEYHYFLPDSLRADLAKPVGDLIEGSIEETLPILKKRLTPHNYLLVAVGDVTADLFVTNNFQPDIIVTDGKTKREELEKWKNWPHFTTIEAICPAAQITIEAWTTLQEAVQKAKDHPIHVKIIGEEDLLVLPLIIELPIGSIVVYGQPNRGAVIREVNRNAKDHAIALIRAMDKKK